MAPAVRLWILLAAGLNAAGWLLSALHLLQGAGYAIVAAVAAAGLLVNRPAGWKLRWQRFRRPLPAAFLVLVVLTLLAGWLYPPAGQDGNMYRTPRTLHWLAEGHWHWIRTLDTRMNTRGAAFEWLSAPLLLLTRTDRSLFLLNWLSYLLLPGLSFAVLRRLGVPGRVAWFWMWLLPAGLCYALQAASIANDSFAVIFALAAVEAALRARARGRVEDLWLCLLAAALLSSSKQTSVLLAPLPLLAAFPGWRLLGQRPLATAAVVLWALLASILPTVLLNRAHHFTWAGNSTVPEAYHSPLVLEPLPNPVWGVVGGSASLVLQNLAPPFFFPYERWRRAAAHFVNSPAGAPFRPFEQFGALGPYPNQQAAALGPFLSLFLAGSLALGWRYRRREPPGRRPWGLLLVPWGLLLVFLSQIGAMETGRMLSPWYPLLLALLLTAPGQAALTRRPWWPRAALLPAGGAMAWMIFSPSQPLWPARTLLERMAAAHPESTFWPRAASFYTTGVPGEALRDWVPVAEGVVGYATDIREFEPQLWRPFTRRVERVLPEDGGDSLRGAGMRFVVVDEYFLEGLVHTSIEELAGKWGGTVADHFDLYKGWQKPPSHLYLIDLAPAPATSGAPPDR